MPTVAPESEEWYKVGLESELHIKEQEQVSIALAPRGPGPVFTFRCPDERQRQIVTTCETHCKTIVELVDQNLLAIQKEHFVDAKQQTKTTVRMNHHPCPCVCHCRDAAANSRFASANADMHPWAAATRLRHPSCHLLCRSG